MGDSRCIRLIHWRPEEAAEAIAALEASGYTVDASPVTPKSVRHIGSAPPAAVLIDLTRLPSQGRDVGLGLRRQKSSRNVPLVFVAGDADKVARIRDLLPDAAYTSWDEVVQNLATVLQDAPAEPVVPDSVMAPYAGVPLARKLDIRAGTVVRLVDAPACFEQTLGVLPDGALVRRGARGSCDLALWFVTSRRDLERRIERLGTWSGRQGLWVIWPKAASGVATDLTQAIVRKVGLAAGLVDYKICAVDATWSGLRFTPRRS